VRILFLAPRYPMPALRGDQRRVLDLLRALRTKAEVTLLAFPSAREQPLPFDGVRVRTIRPSLPGRLLANAARPDPRLPAQVRLFLDAAMAHACREELASRPDVVHVTLARMGPYLPRRGTWHRHLDLVDSLALNMRTRAAASRGPQRVAFGIEARLMEDYEARLVAACESASLVAEADRLRARGLQSAEVIPNGVDLEAFPFEAPRERPDVLLFFGNLGYFHNIEPARRLATEVLPLVRAEIPGAVLRLVGARPAASVRALADVPGVEVVGGVDRMANALHGAAVAAIPMYSGSGMKNKVLESYAAGLPVVTNAAGISGIDGAQPGSDYALGETPAELAAACVHLLRNPAARIAQATAARTLIEARYSWSRQADRLLDLYTQPHPTPSP
jgi:glycosyltransferase involved in cell wall biosynthesis